MSDRRQWSIGELIDALQDVGDVPVWVMVGGVRHYPNGVDSYRGYYEQLAIGYRDHLGRHERQQTATDLADDLYPMRYADITGYKGGTYSTSPDTSVWIANYGNCTESMVVGLDLRPDGVEIVTEQEEW